jgi:hypothetical protein
MRQRRFRDCSRNPPHPRFGRYRNRKKTQLIQHKNWASTFVVALFVFDFQGELLKKLPLINKVL